MGKVFSAVSIFLCVCLLGAITALTYINSIHNPFMFDDHNFFNAEKRNPKNIPSFFLPDRSRLAAGHGGQDYYYRPFAHVVPMLNYLAFGLNPVGHHTVNMVLFWLAALTVFALIRRLFSDPLLAFFAAVLFVVHPINTMLVNYATANVFSCQVIFMSLSFFFLLRPSSKGILSSVFFILSLLCHETSMAMPFYVVIALVIVGGEPLKEALKRTALLWIILAVYMVFRLKYASLSGGIINNYAAFHMSVVEWTATLMRLGSWYLSKLVVPEGIVMIYAEAPARVGIMGWMLVFLLVCAFLGVVWFGRTKIAKPIAAGIFWLAVGFLPCIPASLFQPSRGVLLIEPHWLTFGSLGFMILLGYVLVDLWRKTLWTKALVAGLCGMLIVLSRMTNTVWADELQYGYFWLQESPQFTAVHTLLGKAHQIRGEFDMARRHYKWGLTKHPADQLDYNFNFGLMAMEQHDWDNAKLNMELALNILPNSPVVMANMGAIYYAKSDLDKAQEILQKASALDPKDVLSRMNLGSLFRKKGDIKAACSNYGDALALEPSLMPIAGRRMYEMNCDGKRKGRHGRHAPPANAAPKPPEESKVEENKPEQSKGMQNYMNMLSGPGK